MGDAFDPATLARGTVERRKIVFATTPDGGTSSFPLIAVAGRRPGPVLVCVGGIHGDEFEGPSALWRLAERLDPEALTGTVLIVPVAHMAAFGAGTRASPIDGQNLARIFPGDPEGTHSFRLAHALFSIVRSSDFLVDCHSGGVRLAFLPVAGFYPPDPTIPAAVTARSLDLAKAMGLPHVWRLPPRAGVLSFEAARCGVAIVGAEIGGRGGLLDADSDLYLYGIQKLMASQGMLAGAVPVPDYATCLDGDWDLAPEAGFVDNHVALGDRVAAGALLATIRSPFGDAVAAMRARVDGIVMGVRHLRSIHVGEWATCVVREVAL